MNPAEINTSLEPIRPLLTIARDFGLASLLGLVLGAYLSYAFKASAEKRATIEQQFLAGLKAQFAIVSQLVNARHLLADYLEPRRQDPKRGIGLRSYHVDFHHQTVDFSSLAFLLDKHEGLTTLHSIFHAEVIFKDVIASLHHRNELHEAFRMELSRQQQLANPKIDELLQLTLETATDDLYKFTDLAVSVLHEQLIALGKLLGERFPDRKDSIIEIEKDW